MRKRALVNTATTLLFIASTASAQETARGNPPPQGRGAAARPIVLGPDDVRVFPDAPEGFNTRRAGVPAGRLEPFEYDSAVTGTRRKANVYLPPGYADDRQYPVLYLLHGIGGDETEWIRFATPDALFDNLIADKKAVPMIVVIPNGRALADDRATGNNFAPERAEGFARFERDLLDHLIPAIEKKYRRSPTASTGRWPASRWAAARPSTSGWGTSTGSRGSAPSPPRRTPGRQPSSCRIPPR